MIRYFMVSLLMFAVSASAMAQKHIETTDTDTAFTDPFQVKAMPKFRSGFNDFYKYIQRHLDYPEVALMIGVNGEVKVRFVVEKNGKVSHVEALNCIGAGCESEAVKVIKNSPLWNPGSVSGNGFDRFQFTIPINFTIPVTRVSMGELKCSDYVFFFKIKDKVYTLEQATRLLSRNFSSDRIIIAEPYYDEHFKPADKTRAYLILIK